jgi:hypothetical protein
MKKLILSFFALAAFTGQAQLQLVPSPPAPVNPVKNFAPATNINYAIPVLEDTLNYFYNKHVFKNPWTGGSASPNFLFSSLRTPYPGTAQITHCGGIFLNSAPISITGAEAIVIKESSAPSATVPVRLYICNVNASNIVQFPPIDSLTTGVSNTASGETVGGNFTNPISLTGKFAILVKIASSNPADSIRPFINNASTATSTVPAYQKYGEALGVMRFNGQFYANTGVFGAGTDYEFIVAPRVVAAYTAGAVPITPTACTNSQGSFSNTTNNTTSIVEHRQFNFNKFVSYWGLRTPANLLTNSLVIPANPDSIYTWNFTGSSSPVLYTKNSSAIFNTSGNQSETQTVA